MLLRLEGWRNVKEGAGQRGKGKTEAPETFYRYEAQIIGYHAGTFGKDEEARTGYYCKDTSGETHFILWTEADLSTRMLEAGRQG